MSAFPQPQPGDRRDLVTRFKERYAECLADARRSEEMTRTDAWAKMLDDRHRKDQERRRRDAQVLRLLADKLEDFGFDGKDEKVVRTLLGENASARAEQDSFARLAIEPVLEPARVCQRMIVEAEAEAARTEKAAPLVNIGLVELMRSAIAGVPRALVKENRVVIEGG